MAAVVDSEIILSLSFSFSFFSPSLSSGQLPKLYPLYTWNFFQLAVPRRAFCTVFTYNPRADLRFTEVSIYGLVLSSLLLSSRAILPPLFTRSVPDFLLPPCVTIASPWCVPDNEDLR
ncbi:hypothetical protein B0H13DRAFT_2322312 [Mycena leptocephala]|nr:hypothetical protein B0H13DRAFT_2322312 [Mycena leptocephala]